MSLNDLHRQLERDKFAQAWPAQTRSQYLDFCKHLMQEESLIVKTGAGGLSFYKELDGRRVFVCHFNASPRRGQAELGFADFRRDALEGSLNVDAALDVLRGRLGSEVEVKQGKTWCGLHFPLRCATKIADALRVHFVAPLTGRDNLQAAETISP